jgi:predicted short-subunit dehydrogenase-like oxidoreductase (DUF2520 family)
MKKNSRQKIVIIGCGNLAWHLAKHFSKLKKFALTVYNHRANKQLEAFSEMGCETIPSLGNIVSDASFYFICVSDKYIAEVSELVNPAKASSLVIHTSGSTPISQLVNLNAAVFYPVQTFTKEVEVDWKEVPILIEAANKNDLKELRSLAELFSTNIIHVSSEDRMKIHLAAVIVNNFTNALYTATDNYLSKEIRNNRLNFNLLLPLIKQTTLKLERVRPLQAQTGPAKRGDKQVQKEHTRLLKNDKILKKLYRQLSELIAQQHNSGHA